MSDYEFDARRYCQNNRARMGHRPDGTPIADMIICEIDSRNVRIEALKRELAALKDAARHALMSWSCDCKSDRSEMFKKLAALVGEE